MKCQKCQKESAVFDGNGVCGLCWTAAAYPNAPTTFSNPLIPKSKLDEKYEEMLALEKQIHKLYGPLFSHEAIHRDSGCDRCRDNVSWHEERFASGRHWMCPRLCEHLLEEAKSARIVE